MNKLVHLSLIVMILSVLLITPVFAAKPMYKVTGGGWYLSKAPYSTVLNHHASFGVQAGGPFAESSSPTWIFDNGVSGRGSFMDRDYRLKAILEVTGGAFQEGRDGPNTYWVRLTGTAKVYIENEYAGDMEFRLAFARAAKGERTDRVWFEIPDLTYIAWGDLKGGNVVFHA